MTVILHLDTRMLRFYVIDYFSQRSGTAHTGHVLQRDFFGTGFDELFRHVDVILGGMYL